MLSKVDRAGSSWLVSWNTVFTSCSSKSNCTLHSFISVLIDSEGTAYTKALISIVLVSTLSSGRLGNLLRRYVVTVEFLFSLHPIKIDRHKAGVWLDIGKGSTRHILLWLCLLYVISAFNFSCLIESASDLRTRSLHILYWVKVIQIDILILVGIVSFGL